MFLNCKHLYAGIYYCIMEKEEVEYEKYKKAVMKQLYEECQIPVNITNDYILKSYVKRIKKYMDYAEANTPEGMSAFEFMNSV